MEAVRCRTTFVIACLLAAVLLLGGCTRRAVNGYFVASSGTNQLLMVHVVEAPRGHLSGTIVVTTIDPAGSAPNVSDYDVVGSITGRNVSLKVTGALATIAGWFGDDNILVGSLVGGRLTLSKGSQTFTLGRMSEADYQNRIQALQHLQSNIADVRDAVQGLKKAAAYTKQVLAAFQQYQSWGQARIANQEKVRAWWSVRIKNYSACLARIKPLAEAKVPEWRWQMCVIGVENDAYNRRDALESIPALVAQESTQVASFNTMIDRYQTEMTGATHRLHEVCPNSQHPKRCDALWKSLKTQWPAVMAPHIAAFRALAPQVGQALRADANTAMVDNAKLEAIAAQIQQIYREAR